MTPTQDDQPRGVAQSLLIICSNRGGADLSVRVVEYTVNSGPKMSVGGSVSFNTADVLQAAEDGWVEILHNERAGVVCQPTDRGMDWLAGYVADRVQKVTGR